MICVLNKGVQKVEEKGWLKQIFCKHEDTVTGEYCSPSGFVRINGCTELTICKKCGKVLGRKDTEY